MRVIANVMMRASHKHSSGVRLPWMTTLTGAARSSL
jgi:hypothetical protein